MQTFMFMFEDTFAFQQQWLNGLIIITVVISGVNHWAHDVVATLNQRQWRGFNVATTSCAQCEGLMHCKKMPQISLSCSCMPIQEEIVSDVNKQSAEDGLALYGTEADGDNQWLCSQITSPLGQSHLSAYCRSLAVSSTIISYICPCGHLGGLSDIQTSLDVLDL